MTEKKPFWTSLPGIFTGIAGVIGAVAALLTALHSIGILSNRTSTNETTESVSKQLMLKQPDNTWGKSVHGSWGRLIYFDNTEASFSGSLYLQGLTPNHLYVLAINGKPEHSSNQLLPQKHGAERYADILEIKTDSEGGVSSASFEAYLTPSTYDVKVLIKDTNDWKAVLFHDSLTFTVKG